MIANLDTLLIALYVELTDRIIPALGFARSGPGQRPEVTDAELVCLAVAQVLLRFDGERHWLRAAPKQVGHLFPRLLAQSEYNQRVKAAGAADGGSVAVAGRATRRPARSWCGCWMPPRCRAASPSITARRSDLFGWAGYGYCPSHSRWYWGSKLMLIVYLRGDGDRVWPGQPQAHRRARAGSHDAERSARQPPRARHRHRDGQGPGRRGHRGILRQPRAGPGPDPPGPQRRDRPGTSRTGCGSGSRRSSGR